MDFEQSKHSLKELLDAGIADVFLPDSCILGNDFLVARNALSFYGEFAKKKNIPLWKVREALRSSRASLEMLEQYPQIKIAKEVLAELEEKGYFVRMYKEKFGSRWNHQGRDRWSHTHAQRKEIRMLENLLGTEESIRSVLQQRLAIADGETTKPFEELVIAAYRAFGKCREDKNDNDERIIAAAVYLALREGKSVVIVSNDTRMPSILIRTQRLLSAANSGAKEYSKRLVTTNVSIAGNLNDKRLYCIVYSSCDFKPFSPPIPIAKALQEKVAACLPEERAYARAPL